MTEAELKKACFDYLQLLENKGMLIYIRNNSFSGAIQRPNGSVGYIKNNKKGAPDAFIFLKNGETLHIELKAPKGTQSIEQKEWEKKITKLGHNYYIIRDVDDLTKVIAYYRV